ncbi:hypothetical protein EDD86DRAFT_88169 [Gorgonomyces haynaldii]|nr:hypothetical protein EDD86DRAFT_88169 [Gorgonomyces haynaldii]
MEAMIQMGDGIVSVCNAISNERDTSKKKAYRLTVGVSRIRSPSFLHLRTQFVAKTQLEINRLQKRLDKIAHAESPKLRKRISTLFRSNQDQIVPWEPDEARNSCHVCEQGFTLANRRHHCRLCGLLTDHKCLVRFHSFVSDRELDIKICKQCDFYLEQRGVQIIDSPISDLFQVF